MATFPVGMDEARARDLQAALKARNIESAVHWDRSPWGVRIWLTEEDGPELETPSVYVLTELTESKYRPGCYEWLVCLDGFEVETDAHLSNLLITITEWGETDTARLEHVANTVEAFLQVLRAQVVTT